MAPGLPQEFSKEAPGAGDPDNVCRMEERSDCPPSKEVRGACRFLKSDSVASDHPGRASVTKNMVCTIAQGMNDFDHPQPLLYLSLPSSMATLNMQITSYGKKWQRPSQLLKVGFSNNRQWFQFNCLDFFFHKVIPPSVCHDVVFPWNPSPVMLAVDFPRAVLVCLTLTSATYMFPILVGTARGLSGC